MKRDAVQSTATASAMPELHSGLPTPKERRRTRKKPPVGCSMCRRRRIRCDKGVPRCRNCLSQDTECEYATLPKVGSSTTKVKKTIPGERIVPVMTLAEVEKHAAKSAAKSAAPVTTAATIQTPLSAYQRALSPPAERYKYSGSSSSSSDSGSDRILGSLSFSPSPYQLPSKQHKLLHHMSSLAMSIDATQQSDIVVYLKWLPQFLTIAFNYEFVMHGLMAWAASHMAFTTQTAEPLQVAAQFRYSAIKGLGKAVRHFNVKNSDAVLAASLLLSWQAPDPLEWATFNQGVNQVLAALSPWSTASLFHDYIAENHIYAAAPSIIQPPINFLPAGPSGPLSSSSNPSTTSEASALSYIHSALSRCTSYILSVSSSSHATELSLLRHLQSFVSSVSAALPITHPAQRFYICEPVRSMLYWYPVSLYESAQSSSITLVTLAHLYAISLTVQPVFAGPGAAHFRGLSCVPIEKIWTRLEERHQRNMELVKMEGRKREREGAKRAMETWEPLSLMGFPMQSVRLFRARIGLSDGGVGEGGVMGVDESLEGIRMGLDPEAVKEATELGLIPGND